MLNRRNHQHPTHGEPPTLSYHAPPTIPYQRRRGCIFGVCILQRPNPSWLVSHRCCCYSWPSFRTRYRHVLSSFPTSPSFPVTSTLFTSLHSSIRSFPRASCNVTDCDVTSRAAPSHITNHHPPAPRTGETDRQTDSSSRRTLFYFRRPGVLILRRPPARPSASSSKGSSCKANTSLDRPNTRHLTLIAAVVNAIVRPGWHSQSPTPTEHTHTRSKSGNSPFSALRPPVRFRPSTGPSQPATS